MLLCGKASPALGSEGSDDNENLPIGASNALEAELCYLSLRHNHQAEPGESRMITYDPTVIGPCDQTLVKTR